MNNWILVSLYTRAIVGNVRGYHTRSEAESAAQNLSTMSEHWYTEIGVFQLVSKAKFAPKGELERVDADAEQSPQA